MNSLVFKSKHLNRLQQIQGATHSNFLLCRREASLPTSFDIIFCCTAECITRIKWLCAPSFTGSCSPDIWRGWVRDLRAHRHPSVQVSKVRQWQGIAGNFIFVLFISVLPSASAAPSKHSTDHYLPISTSGKYLCIDFYQAPFQYFNSEEAFLWLVLHFRPNFAANNSPYDKNQWVWTAYSAYFCICDKPLYSYGLKHHLLIKWCLSNKSNTLCFNLHRNFQTEVLCGGWGQ